MSTISVDLVVIGGGLGGCAATLAACSQGLRVLLIEETEWLGGQVTSQGVPPDEHQWIEEFGSTRRYRNYRENVRQSYKRIMQITDTKEPLNPGNGLVSNLCHDPRVSLHVLNEMLLPFTMTNQLIIKLRTKVVQVKRNGKAVQAIVLDSGETIRALYFIDATESGEILPLADLDYVTGAESKAETGEPHALDSADPDDIQAFIYVLAMEYREGENHQIDRPEMYDFWREFHPDIWPDKLLSFYAPHPITKEKRQYTLFREEQGFPLWEYRRMFHSTLYDTPRATGDITLMNWPQNDYFLGNIYDVSPQEREKHLYQAKQLSLSLLYWLQTEAPRSDGGKGYPGLKLRYDVFDTKDGLAKSAYIRESRRIKAEYCITEKDVSPDFNEGKTGKFYRDRVGIGSYSIDLHPSMTGRNYLDIKALPFHIPLGALIPKDIDNLLAGCKNIGTTHITNGCYRLHPTEWNIGEACGELVAFCLGKETSPKEVRENDKLLIQFQNDLRASGFELEWPEEFYH
ncbi:FAD-dependent oxidoreductase [Guptibacillus sedimenti]|uniref:FAD-dependent oxidoreductase n=1 Tax=Guptibacillus sedimenti TaxID=3025680 RepID=UPI002362D19A|nr:FAD-dependent oxidoreductase [Pseudalkalibacillus sedimenti]